jgi:uroporphyrinogen-III synthase
LLQSEMGMTEEKAYRTLQQQSRQTRKSMKQIAEAIILADDVKRSFRTT